MAPTGPLPLLIAERDLTIIWNGLWLAACLLVAALAIVGVNKWRKWMTSESTTASDQLTLFREMYEKGELSKEEFDRIKARLGLTLRQGKEPALPAPVRGEPRRSDAITRKDSDQRPATPPAPETPSENGEAAGPTPS